jgi:hypothetical protein
MSRFILLQHLKIFTTPSKFDLVNLSILNFIANNLPSEHIQTIYADLPSFPNPSIITGDDYCPGLLILTKDNCLYVLELTVGYETNLRNNIQRKYSKYKEMIVEQKKKFRPVKFINLSISALDVFEKESSHFIQMLEPLNSDKAGVKYIIRKIINIAIRTTYYVFCSRNDILRFLLVESRFNELLVSLLLFVSYNYVHVLCKCSKV